MENPHDELVVKLTYISRRSDLISFDTAIDLILNSFRVSNLSDAVSCLDKYLQPEDLTTIWVSVVLAHAILTKSGVPVRDADQFSFDFITLLRGLRKMRDLFIEMPATEEQMDQRGHQIDDLVIRVMATKGTSIANHIIDTNPVLLSMLADVRITMVALDWYLEGDQSHHWEIRELLARKRRERQGK